MEFIVKGISETVGECSVCIEANNKEEAEYIATHDNDYDFVEIFSVEQE